MTDQGDRENLVALIMRANDGSLDEWLNTLNTHELQYALVLLKNYHTARENFFNLL